MRIYRQFLSTLIFTVLLLFIFTANADAKPRFRTGDGAVRTRAERGLIRADEAGRVSAPEVERRFRPFLEERIAERRGAAANASGLGSRADIQNAPPPAVAAVRPSQRDYLLLMKVWDNLSPEFRALYNEAASIPSHLNQTHISPMDKFKIYYTTTGRDSVDVTDTIGYGAAGDQSAWRQRTSGGNDVPDYIDEVAFALDSAWSMLVDRFGFEKPLSDSGVHYRVYVNRSWDYGTTEPIRRVGTKGYSSVIEINGNWSNPIWAPYDKYPYDAAYVTAAHELFHGVQFAMAHVASGAIIDDFPLAWIEGAAVLMEELAFPDVNDYLQYIEDYFAIRSNPTNPPRISFFTDNYSDEYLNSILFKYLYERVGPRDSIGFVKTATYNQFNQSGLRFNNNIDQTARSYDGRKWAEILNGFHTESYFTGNRARAGLFLDDAELMDTWAIPAVSNGEVIKTIRQNSVEFYYYTPHPEHSDTMYINIKGERANAADSAIWAASILVLEIGGNASIVTVPIDQNGYGGIAIEDWKEKAGCVVVVTNANPSASRKATVTPSNEFIPPPVGNIPIVIAPNRVHLRFAESVKISGGDITEVKIMSPEGRVIGYYKHGKTSGGSESANKFSKNTNGTVTWHIDKRLVPGVYYVLASSASSKKKGMQKRKVVILP